MMDIKKIMIVGVIVTMLLVSIGTAVNAKAPEGKPFQEIWDAITEVNERIDNIQLTPGPKGDKGDKGDTGAAGADGVDGEDGTNGIDGADGEDGTNGIDGATGPAGPEHIGIKVPSDVPNTNLYEVHTRVLWDAGWTPGAPLVNFGDIPVYLKYGTDITLFYQPLKGYGIPAIPAGATRKTRLYVNYGHHIYCGSNPTIDIGGVDFVLPKVGGEWFHMGAGWSNFQEYGVYSAVGHTPITIRADNCDASAAVYRIEAHFYDQYPV